VVKTVFVCDSLNLRVEGLDNRPYSVNERITLKHQGRWLPMIVDEVRERGTIRQVMLRVNTSPDSLYVGRAAGEKATSKPAIKTDDTWLKTMLDTISGGHGPVVW